jgi:hypothetical protein
MHRAGDTPADDAARKHIDDESHIYEPRQGRNVCEIGDPEQRVKKLDEENLALRKQLEVAYGELYQRSK